MQTILDGEKLKVETKLERLYRLRLQYYEEYCNDIANYRAYTKQKVMEYKNIVKDIDKQIDIEKWKIKKAQKVNS